MNKKIISITFALVMISLVLVAGADYVKKNSIYDIKHPVRIDGHPNNNIACNISVFDPNNTEIVDYAEMTNKFEFHNYTLNSTYLNDSGRYLYDITCSTGVSNETESFEFFVNPTGIEPSDQRTESITRGIYVLFGASVIFFIAFMFMNAKLPVRLTFFMLSFLFFLTALNLLSVSLVDEVVNPALENFFDGYLAIHFVLFWFTSGLLLFIWLFTFLNTIIMKQNERNIRRFQ